MGLSLAGYAVASLQVAVEQLSLDSAGFSRWEILGVEGLVGLAVSLALLALLQASAASSAAVSGTGLWAALDVPAHTVCCLGSSAAPGALAAAYGAASFSFNALLLLLAAAVGPNARVLVFTARGLLTWAAECAAGYSGSSASLGWGSTLTPWAALQALGYAALIGGGLARVRLQAGRQQAEAAARAAAEALGKE